MACDGCNQCELQHAGQLVREHTQSGAPQAHLYHLLTGLHACCTGAYDGLTQHQSAVTLHIAHEKRTVAEGHHQVQPPARLQTGGGLARPQAAAPLRQPWPADAGRVARGDTPSSAGGLEAQQATSDSGFSGLGVPSGLQQALLEAQITQPTEIQVSSRASRPGVCNTTAGIQPRLLIILSTHLLSCPGCGLSRGPEGRRCAAGFAHRLRQDACVPPAPGAPHGVSPNAATCCAACVLARKVSGP